MMKKRIVSMFLVFCTVITILPLSLNAYVLAESEEAVPFADVNREDWFYSSVEYVHSAGLMNGIGDSKFAPSNNLTRGMFVTVLGRVAGIDITEYSNNDYFLDVQNGQWYTPYIIWATESGIVNGYGGGKFGVENAVTRQDMAVIVSRYINANEIVLTELETTVKDFEDKDSIDDYAEQAIKLMQKTGIIQGDDKGNFNPKETATRAEAATIFMNLKQSIKSDINNEGEPIILESQGHGEYSIPAAGSLSSSDDNEAVAYATEDDEIYEIEDKYLLEVYEGTYLLSDKIDIDCNADTSVLENLELPDVMIQEIETMIEQQKEINNDEFEISVYVPASNTIEEVTNEPGASLSAALPVNESGIVYYTYKNNTKMRAYWWKCNTAHTGMKTVKKGTGDQVKSAMKAFFDISLSIAGEYSEKFSIFGYALNVYDLFKSFHGDIMHGTAANEWQMDVSYHKKWKLDQVYYAPKGVWWDGASTAKVWLNMEMNYNFINGKGYYSEKFINKEIFSPHYNYAAEWAYTWAPTMQQDKQIYLTLPTGRFEL